MLGEHRTKHEVCLTGDGNDLIRAYGGDTEVDWRRSIVGNEFELEDDDDERSSISIVVNWKY